LWEGVFFGAGSITGYGWRRGKCSRVGRGKAKNVLSENGKSGVFEK